MQRAESQLVTTPPAAERNGRTVQALDHAASRKPVKHFRLLVIADDAVEGKAVAAWLNASPSITTSYAESRREAQRRIERAGFEGVVWIARHVDDVMLAFAADTRRKHPCVPLCLVARTFDIAGLRDLAFGGSRGLGVLIRDTDLEAKDILRCLLELTSGRAALSPAVLEQMLSDSRHHAPSLLDRLSDVEVRVLGLVALGLRNREIARRIQRSEKLVERHMGRIFRKLDLCAEDSVQLDRRVTAARMFLLCEREAARSVAGEPP